eukprot:3948022-Pleurochrysis_carterae.AAC.1
MPAISSVAPLNAAESSARRSSVGISPTSPQTSLISWVRATRAICRCVARAPAVPSACNSFTIPGHRAGHSCLASSTSSKASDSRTRCGSVSKSPSPWSTKPSTCRRSALCRVVAREQRQQLVQPLCRSGGDHLTVIVRLPTQFGRRCRIVYGTERTQERLLVETID